MRFVREGRVDEIPFLDFGAVSGVIYEEMKTKETPIPRVLYIRYQYTFLTY